MARDVVWMGETKCDFCHQEITKTLFDAKTIMGPWATMCPDCYKKHGISVLGKGLGQKYEKQKDEKFHKVDTLNENLGR